MQSTLLSGRQSQARGIEVPGERGEDAADGVVLLPGMLDWKDKELNANENVF